MRQRRSAILEAATELFAGLGYQHTSVKQVCQQAGLTQRYFYESFADKESALVTVYDELVEGMRAHTLAAIESAPQEDGVAAVVERGLSAFVEFLTADTRRAQIVLVEVVGVSPRLESRRHSVLDEFAQLVAGVWLGQGRQASQYRLTAVALVGGVNHLLVDWLLGGRVQEPAELVQACVTLFVGADRQLASHSDPVTS